MQSACLYSLSHVHIWSRHARYGHAHIWSSALYAWYGHGQGAPEPYAYMVIIINAHAMTARTAPYGHTHI